MIIRLIEPIGIELDEVVAALPGHDVAGFDSRGWDDARLIAQCPGAEVLLTTNRPLSAVVIDALPDLRLIAVAFAGIDSIDPAAARSHGVRIEPARGYANTAVAELVMGFLISLARRIPQHNTEIRAGGVGSVGNELRGKTLGVVGVGAIGHEVIRLARSFGMDTLAFDRDQGTPLSDLFSQSDFVSLHLPLTDETRGIVGSDLLGRMKPTAFLVNTARGPIVDHDALVSALGAGRPAGAALDVFDVEPPIPVDEPLLTFDSVIATPHIGFDTAEAVRLKGEMALQQVVDYAAAPSAPG